MFNEKDRVPKTIVTAKTDIQGICVKYNVECLMLLKAVSSINISSLRELATCPHRI